MYLIIWQCNERAERSHWSHVKSCLLCNLRFRVTEAKDSCLMVSSDGAELFSSLHHSPGPTLSATLPQTLPSIIHPPLCSPSYNCTTKAKLYLKLGQVLHYLQTTADKSNKKNITSLPRIHTHTCISGKTHARAHTTRDGIRSALKVTPKKCP